MICAYIRVSTDRQTIESQRFAIEEYCKQNALTVSKWVFEKISGKTAGNKRKLGGLINKLKKGDTLICSEISRLGRDMLMIMGILNDCASKDIKIIAVKGNYRLENSLYSKIFAMAYSITSELERDFISQRTKDALALKKTQGIKLGRPLGAKSKRVKLSGKEEKIKFLMQNNTPIAEIARIFKVNRETVRRFVKTMNL